MNIHFGQYPQAIVLVFARLATVMALVPFYGGLRSPAKIKVALALMVTVAILPVLSDEFLLASNSLRTLPEMFFALLNEVLLGAAIAFICNVLITGATIGGMIVGRESALMMARSIDPLGGKDNTIMAQILRTLFVLLIVLSNAHLLLIKLLAGSFNVASTFSMGWMNAGFFDMVVRIGGQMFALGLKIALPIVCASFILNVGFGLISRMAPDFNILFLALPFRLLCGLSVFGIVLRMSSEMFNEVVEEMLRKCALVLGV